MKNYFEKNKSTMNNKYQTFETFIKKIDTNHRLTNYIKAENNSHNSLTLHNLLKMYLSTCRIINQLLRHVIVHCSLVTNHLTPPKCLLSSPPLFISATIRKSVLSTYLLIWVFPLPGEWPDKHPVQLQVLLLATIYNMHVYPA